jgi:hypothetical protein
MLVAVTAISGSARAVAAEGPCAVSARHTT